MKITSLSFMAVVSLTASGLYRFSNELRVQQSLQNPSDSFPNQNERNSPVRSYLSNVSNDTILFYGPNDMNTLVKDVFHDLFCPRILQRHNNTHGHIIVHVSFGCDDVFRSNNYGTGNFLMSLYSLRTTAKAMGNVDVLIECSDAEEQKSLLILPWLTGWYPHDENSNQTSLLDTTQFQGAPIRRKCIVMNRRFSSPLGDRVDDIQYELRRMAVSLVGVPSKDHPSYAFARELQSSEHKAAKSAVYELQFQGSEDEKPILFGVELDDAVLHFRCGDLIDSVEPRYGFMRFDSYANQISSHVRSIGIVTESFDADGQHRISDTNHTTRDRCRIVVYAFVEHLEKRFPNARVSIRNGPGETIALSYARMVMANQTVVGYSTFGFFPAISTFGQALIRRPPKNGLGWWLIKSNIEQKANNVVLFNETDWLYTARCKQLWKDDGSAVLEWFRNNTK